LRQKRGLRKNIGVAQTASAKIGEVFFLPVDRNGKRSQCGVMLNNQETKNAGGGNLRTIQHKDGKGFEMKKYTNPLEKTCLFFRSQTEKRGCSTSEMN